MIEIKEEYIDNITKAVYNTLKGERASAILIPDDLPDNELRQLIIYFNQFINEYDDMQKFIYSISRGELEYDPPKGKMKVLQSFKSLQASLKHLTWKTQQISMGDFNQKVDFMGDFAAAFNKMTDQLKEAFEKIEKQKIELSEKNRKITDSILYAERIQKAILPSESQIVECAGDSFVIYKPKDIVSGDFYWCTSNDGQKILAVADCTGHGVPGGFLTMIANNLLNKIVIENKVKSPENILKELDKEMKSVLKQNSEDFDARKDTLDGLDIALISFFENKIFFSGAKRPIYIVNPKRENSILRYKGDNSCIGGKHRREAVFTNQEIDICKGDMIYLFSDGYIDQNDKDGNKFGTQKFEKVLLDIYEYTTTEQKLFLEKEMDIHMGREEQRDDMIILGIRR